jgi:hypothetical protein
MIGTFPALLRIWRRSLRGQGMTPAERLAALKALAQLLLAANGAATMEAGDDDA